MTFAHTGIALALMAAALIVWCGWRVARSRFNAVQWIMMGLASLLVRFLWRARYENAMPIPREGGAVYIANHRSSVDPFFIQTRSDRPIHWMVAKEYCEHPTFRWLLRQCEVIPTNRGGIDTAATKAAIRYASQGEFVGMFPEGRINQTDDFMLPCRPGAILVALKARVPIIPCYIQGSPYGGTAGSPFRMRARVRVKFGEPIDLSEYYGREDDSEVVRNLTIRCVKELAKLAGKDDFQPTLAGRRWKPDSQEAERSESEDSGDASA